jgi:N-acyl-D-amino-acid deacylase
VNFRRFPLARVLIAAAWTFAPASGSADEAYDFILRNGRVVDGSGNPAFTADVAVKGGLIAEVGRITKPAKAEWDVSGLVIAPGFIDVHTHAEDVEDRPEAENFLRMGVTTLVLGNCGASTLNVAQFFGGLETAGSSANVATLIGHGTVRNRAMRGSFARPPTEEEMAQMRTLVNTAMADGALGLSTGLIYTPGVFAQTEEIMELAKVAAAYDGIYATHQRSESAEIFKSLDEILRIATEARIRVQVSHLKLSGPANWHQAEKVLGVIEAGRGRGIDITQDQYPYTASSTGMGQLIPDSMKDGGRAKFLERLLDPSLKEQCIAEMKETLRKRNSDDYSYAVIASHRADPTLNGLSIAEAALRLRGANTVDDQIETIFHIERNGSASGVFHGMSDADLETFLRHPNTMVASDSGVRKFNADVPHPRGYGTFARILGLYVREKRVIRLEDAIRRMTSLPARTFQLAGRGEIRVGSAADITVFDPATVADRSTYNNPHHYSTGFRLVFVNGALVIERDQHTGARPGLVLRHKGRGALRAPVATAN